MNKVFGFTLIELMITVAIFAILAVAALPSFNGFIENNILKASANDFVGALQLAKAESASRTVQVTVCKRAIDGDGDDVCTTGGDWQQGWIVFSDDNQDGVFDEDDGESILFNHEALASSISFGGTSEVVDFITYKPSGFTSLTSTQVLIMCDARGWSDNGLHAKAVLVTAIGRSSAMLATDTNQTACL